MPNDLYEYRIEFKCSPPTTDLARNEMCQWLNDLGTQGWELITVDKDIYFFKRLLKQK